MTGHGETWAAGHRDMSLCLLCLSLSGNLTEGKTRPFELPFRKISCSFEALVLRSWTSLWFRSLGGSLPHLSLSGLPPKAGRRLPIPGFFSKTFVFLFLLSSCCLS